MNHASVKDFAATHRASILEVFMFLTFMTACTVVIISRTHSFTSFRVFCSWRYYPVILVESFPEFYEGHVRLSRGFYCNQSLN